jgi:hypothetical protein
MLILASIADKLLLTTASAGSVDVHASWMDNVAGAVVPGRTNTANISTAATTTIVGSPAANVFRNVKTLHINNRGTADSVVTVLHNDGIISVELYKTTLPPGALLQYIDEVGFIVGASGIGARDAGSLVLLQTQTITTPVTQMVFNKGIDNTYDIFEFRIINVRMPDPNWVYLQISNDLGVNWFSAPSSYQLHFEYISPATSPPIAGHNFDSAMQVTNQLANAEDRTGNMSFGRFVQPWASGAGSRRKPFMGESCTIQETDGLSRMSWVGEYFGNPFVAGQSFNAIRFIPYPHIPSTFTEGVFSLYAYKK